MARVVRVVLLVVLLFILASLVWLRATPQGREVADEASRRWQQWRHGGDEEAAAAKLQAMGARVGRLPPEQRVVSINCTDMTLGDEGYRLVGRCFNLQTASFIGCDLDDDRMRHLAGLGNLTSLVVAKTPAVTEAGIKQIASLRQLVGLILNGTGIGDYGLKELGRFPELATLDLSHTRVTDEGLPVLARLGKLQCCFWSARRRSTPSRRKKRSTSR